MPIQRIRILTPEQAATHVSDISTTLGAAVATSADARIVRAGLPQPAISYAAKRADVFGRSRQSGLPIVTNLMTINPLPAWTAVYGTGGAGDSTVVPSVGHGSRDALVTTWSTAATAGAATWTAGTGTHLLPVVAGTNLAFAAWLKSSVATTTVAVRFTFKNDANTVISTLTSSNSSLAATVEQMVSYQQVVPAGATHVEVQLRIGTPSVMVAGSTFAISAPTLSGEVISYFDGEDSDAAWVTDPLSAASLNLITQALATWTATYGTGGAGTFAIATGGGHAGSDAAVMTWTHVATGGGATLTAGLTPYTITATPLDSITFDVYITATKAASILLRMSWLDAGGTVLDFPTSTAIVLTPGVEKHFTYTHAVIAGATHMQPQIRVLDSSVFTVGDTLSASLPTISNAANPSNPGQASIRVSAPTETPVIAKWWRSLADEPSIPQRQFSKVFSTIPTLTNPYLQVNVVPSVTRQQFMGCGAAISDATAYLFMTKMTQTQRTAMLTELFSPSANGWSTVRIGLGGTDFSSQAWTSLDETIQGTLASAASSGATSISSTVSFPSGTSISIATSTGSATVTSTGAPSGAGPYTIPVTALPAAFASGARVNERDPSFTKFALTADLVYVIPLLREILAINPKLIIMAAPWAPPAWMRTTQGFARGAILPEALQDYANYLQKAVNAYKDLGINIYGISAQNEPFDPVNSYIPFTGAALAAFIRDYLGPAFFANRVSTKIFTGDHHWSFISDVMDFMSDANARSFVSGSFWHGYGGQPGSANQITRAYPGMENHSTELRTLLVDDWEDASRVMVGDYIIGSMRYDANTVTLWNLALDETGAPSLASPGRRGVITIPSDGSGTVVRNVDYHALWHLSKVAKPGARRIDSNSYKVGKAGFDIQSLAFLNTDGSVGVLLYNGGEIVRNGSVVDTRTGKAFTVAMQPFEISSFIF